jgi:hypothetical protein
LLDIFAAELMLFVQRNTYVQAKQSDTVMKAFSCCST